MAEEKTFELPDFIIQKVQSFLSHKDAATSCFLNKAWLRSWRTTPFLDFDQPRFLRRNEKTKRRRVWNKEKKKKRCMAEEKTFELPDFIIQKVQSFLSHEDAATNCFLNKAWLRSWRTTPFLDFDQPRFLRRNEKTKLMLQKAVTSTLVRYRRENLLVGKLRLCLQDLSMAPLLDYWVEVAAECGLESLSLRFNRKQPFNLLRLINRKGPVKFLTLKTLTAKTLQELSLLGCRFPDQKPKVQYPRLVFLKLRDVLIEEHTLRNLLNNCPLIDTLILDKLESSSSGKAMIRTSFLNQLLPRLPLLKDLTLKRIQVSSNRIDITCDSLRKLCVANMSSLEELGVYAAELQCLEYVGNAFPRIYLSEHINLGKLKYGMNLKPNPFNDTRDWFHKFREVLLQLLPSKTELVIRVPKGHLIQIPSKDFQGLYPIRGGKHVYLETDSSFVLELAIVLEPVISMYCDPRYVSTFWELLGEDVQFEKLELFLFEKLELMRRKVPDSSQLNMKCWLKEVQLAQKIGDDRAELKPLMRDGWKYGPAITTKEKSSSIRITYGLKW